MRNNKLNNNSSMQELHDLMESFIVMKELTNDECNLEIDDWSDVQGYMLSYVDKHRYWKCDYLLRIFYRYDTPGYSVQFQENIAGLKGGDNYNELGEVTLSVGDSIGYRIIRIHLLDYNHLIHFLNYVMKEWGCFNEAL